MKRIDIKRRPLADTVLLSLEPEAKEYREAYGIDRLSFVVSPNGRKRWEMRHKKADGKWTWMGLGGYPETSAKRAREKAREIADLVEGGIDPIQHKQSAKKANEIAAANTFRAAANACSRKRRRTVAPTLRSTRSAPTWKRTFCQQ
ncbi:Arm DNA-binding domain-containing protein [Pseudomonas sp. MAFF 302046]|uniref:Arm DNA-binding domain-containing protein n=1 Tax=Pseudomonas morbosilactucae TaxID=2938197 RepID=A0ABT0JEU7_9PSED|nr:Arm DNA-binding domain-containing protein [Pseudomonas morbosilactucae]MCK9814420.1 Arm DNA-binding domain-containing protein [Pseudomonas morbosilactucae]